MGLVLGIALFGQSLLTPLQGYTLPGAYGDLEVATPDGRYALWYGFNCDRIDSWQNVEVWLMDAPPDQAIIAPLDPTGRVETHSARPDGTVENLMCSVAVLRVSDEPCAFNPQGTCDVALEGSTQ